MISKHLKAAGAAVSLLVASSPALAVSTGSQILGASPVALDAYTFTCPIGTFSARASVADTVFPFFNVPARMRVVLTKAAAFPTAAPQAEDALPALLGGEGLASSPRVIVFGGTGPYRAMFSKTAGGFDSYVGTITCNTIFGIPILPAVIPDLPPLGPLAIPQQNQ